MTAYDRFRDYQPELHPYWLRGPWGTAWAGAFGLVKDAVSEAATQAAKVGMVSQAPADALAVLAVDRNIDRGPGESDDAFRARLRAAFDAWSWAGTDKGIVDQLAVIDLTARVKRNNQWDWDGHPGNVAPYWARMWVLIDQPNGATSGPVVGGFTAGDGTLVGIGTWTRETVQYVTGVIRKWKSAHAKCVFAIVIISGRLVGDDWLIGSGTVGGESARMAV